MELSLQQAATLPLASHLVVFYMIRHKAQASRFPMEVTERMMRCS
jgi:hypothetical protein